MIKVKFDNQHVWFNDVLIIYRCIFCLCDTKHYTENRLHKGHRIPICTYCAKRHDYEDILPQQIKDKNSNRYETTKRFVRKP